MKGGKRVARRVRVGAERLKLLHYMAFKKGTTVEALLRGAIKDFIKNANEKRERYSNS
jgi:hypothetical protein